MNLEGCIEAYLGPVKHLRWDVLPVLGAAGENFEKFFLDILKIGF